MRYASVLGLIGFSCAIAGTCILLCRRTGAIAAAAGGLLGLIALLQFTWRQLHAGRLRQLLGGHALASRPSARRRL